MATIKTDATTVEVKKERGEICKIGNKEYFIRAPKAKDMIALEKKFQTHTSQFAQGLLLISHLSEDLTFEMLEDMYVDDLTEVFAVFEKLMPAKS